jgi:serine/threonine-protein kinase RsbW
MTQEQWYWTRSARIPSETQAGYPFVQQLLDQMKQRQWCERDIFGVHLAVEEALVNAIKHGNAYDADKSVEFTFQLSNDCVRVSIADEGAGFTPSDVPDPTDDDNLELPSGRGIMLMRNFMSNIEYNDRGNHVTMEKRRSRPEDESRDAKTSA